jgi:hypothetical protein
MMEHPIHLHGLWSELENGHGEYRPYKHTINVKPGEKLSYLSAPTWRAVGPIAAISYTTWRWACSGRCASHERRPHHSACRRVRHPGDGGAGPNPPRGGARDCAGIRHGTAGDGQPNPGPRHL